jgi:spermidine synthase
VVASCKKHLQEISGNLSDPRVNYIFQDGIQFVQDAHNAYDVIIIDSSDPIGPAKPLFEKAFYAAIQDALKEDGLMVCQSQSPVMHMDILKQTVQYIRDLFPVQRVYVATVPTYPGGLWSFTMGSKKYQELKGDALPEDTHYINKETLHGCFQLPQFVKRAIYE